MVLVKKLTLALALGDSSHLSSLYLGIQSI